MQSIIYRFFVIWDDFAPSVRVELTIDYIFDLQAKRRMNMQIENPFDLIQGKFVLPILEVHQRLQDVCFWVVISIFNGTLDI